MYLGDTDNYHVTKCLHHLASQDDVSGVFLNVNLSSAGGFTILRHNVALLTLEYSGYYEYGMSSRRKLTSKLWPNSTTDISVAATVKPSNFFSLRNRRGLVHHLFTHKEYTHMLVKEKTYTGSIAFREVFRSGTVTVLKRVKTVKEKKFLFRMKDIESMVFKEEAGQLHAFGLKDLAALRYEEFLRLGGKSS